MDKLEIADLITRFLQGSVSEWEFDDFLSIPLKGKLDCYRIEIAQLPLKYPPQTSGTYCGQDGLSRLYEIAKELKA